MNIMKKQINLTTEDPVEMEFIPIKESQDTKPQENYQRETNHSN